jgi:hypothetical protein
MTMMMTATPCFKHNFAIARYSGDNLWCAGKKELILMRNKIIDVLADSYCFPPSCMMDWIDLAQDSDRWQTLVNAVINARVL